MTWYERAYESGRGVILVLVAVMTISLIWQGFSRPTLIVVGALITVLLVWAVAIRVTKAARR